MRIAVSGTHCSGKSTLVEDFLAAHADYAHEPEPYEWLDSPAGEPDAGDFYRQLEICVERLRGYGPGARMIAERSPLDFLAYLLALGDLRRGGRAPELIEPAIELAARGTEHLDLLVVLPLHDGLAAPEAEDLELREAMHERLMELVAADDGNVHVVVVVEVHGTRRQRLAALERALACTIAP